MLEISEYLKFFVGLLALINPLGVVPIFISMTPRNTPAERNQIIDQVGIGVAIILLVALFFGELLLQFFAITIDSFRVGGGILILIMAISMIQAKTSAIKQTSEEAQESSGKSEIAIVPLAMPLLAGPGSISTVILAAHRGNTVGHYLLVACSIVLLAVAVWWVLRLSPFIVKRISATGINISSRIMGLVLSAIAVEFIANGLKGLFPALNSMG